jgi:hypothetical protein
MLVLLLEKTRIAKECLPNHLDASRRVERVLGCETFAEEPAGCVVEATERSRVATAMYEWVDHPQPFRIDADDRRS